MEFYLKSRHGAYPVEVTIDEDNYRFTVRNVDTTGEFFNSACELVAWVKMNWDIDDFEHPEEYEQMMHSFHQICELS